MHAWTAHSWLSRLRGSARFRRLGFPSGPEACAAASRRRSTSRATSSRSSRAAATNATARRKQGEAAPRSTCGPHEGRRNRRVVVPGNSEQSLIVRRLLGLDGEDRMPKDGDPLPAAQIALIRAWIDQGAGWPETGDAPISAPRTPRRRNSRALGLSPAVASRAARGRHGRMGAHADRSLRPRPAREGRTGALARGAARNARAPRLARFDRAAAVAAGSGRGAGRRRARRQGRRPTRGSSIGCSPRRTTASAGRGRGSISRATPIRRASKKICRA